MTPSPHSADYGSARGFLRGHEDSEQSKLPWLVMRSLPCDVFGNLCLVEPYGRRKVSDAPDAVFFKVHFSDEFKLLLDVDRTVALQCRDGITDGHAGRDFDLKMDMILITVVFKNVERGVFFECFPKTGSELCQNIRF